MLRRYRNRLRNDRAERGGNPTFIDYVILSHADRDHADCLATVLENLDVGVLWMNRPWLCVDGIADRFHGTFTVHGLYRTAVRRFSALGGDVNYIIKIIGSFLAH
jgi:glyoxylase-like metal-dependent hydrolase (beta-lactamase superfamily II)